MSGRAVRTLTVVEKFSLTPHMLRIVLGGESLKDFPVGSEGGYVKLCFPRPDGDENAKPIMRSYTVRYFDQQAKTLTLDFVDHGDAGPASAWARGAEVEDEIITNGPGAVQLINPQADWFLIAGDMTAFPAIQVNCELLPENAKGYVVVEVLSEDDKQPLQLPEGIELNYVINPDPEQGTRLVDSVKTLPWLEGQVSAWGAGEFELMRGLRRYFRQERQLERGSFYLSSYWKIGDTDEGNKAAKKSDTEASI